MYRNNNSENYDYEDHYSRSVPHRRPVPGDLDLDPSEQYYSSQAPMTSGAFPVSYPSVPEPHQPRPHANVDSSAAGYPAGYSSTAYDPANYHDNLRPEAAYNNPYGGASTPVYEPDQMHMYSSPAGSHSYSALYPQTSGAQDENKEDDSYLLKPIGPRPYANSLNPSKASLGDEEMGYQNQNYAGDTYALNTYEEPEDLEPEARDDISLPENGDEQDFYSHEGQHIRRHKTLKRVRLFRGNLVLDCPVSQKLLSQYPSDRNEREFTHMRYSAATCDPADFVDNGFTLRQMCYQQPRTTELFIVVTMYNEDEILLGRTLKGVFKNIAHLMSRKRSNTWGADAWKKVVVCVVSDGRQKINPRSRALLAAMGVYQEGFAKNIVNDKPVSAHIYEYTTLVGINSVGKTVKLSADKAIPVQMLFCLKEKNQKKINSHRWFFQAFCSILRPNVCILLDAGTQPGSDSIYHLWKSFDTSPNIGGACGEIKCMLGTGGKNLINPLVAAQNFEYKMSNILDKPLESVFGFISVLPGAFSAYKYEALLNDSHGEGPLEKYFKGETLHDSGAGIFTANMYLAEDRILCFELVAKRNSKWLLRYVKSAYAETDVPDGLAELILQRRRWLNGSFFAGLYGIFHVFNIWRSSHSFLRKMWLHVEFFYQSINLLVSWFAIGNFFLVFQILTHSLGDPTYTFPPGKILSDVLFYLYSACLVAAFVLSFGNRPQGTNLVYVIMVTFFAVLMVYLIFAAVWISVKAAKIELCLNNYKFTSSLIFENSIFRNLVISMLSTYALYILSSLLFFEPWHMITSFLQYMLLSPSYTNVLNVYAFCNIHDISWGTKGDTGVNTDLGIAKTSSTTGKLEVEIPTEQAEIDAAYMNELEVIANQPLKDVKPKGYDAEKEADYYALIRTTVVLLWMFTNIAIVAYIRSGLVDYTGSDKTPDSCGQVDTTADSKIISYYLAVLMYTVAGLAAFRFIGACTYLVARIFGH